MNKESEDKQTWVGSVSSFDKTHLWNIISILIGKLFIMLLATEELLSGCYSVWNMVRRHEIQRNKIELILYLWLNNHYFVLLKKKIITLSVVYPSIQTRAASQQFTKNTNFFPILIGEFAISQLQDILFSTFDFITICHFIFVSFHFSQPHIP